MQSKWRVSVAAFWLFVLTAVTIAADPNKDFSRACSRGDLTKVEKLLLDVRVDPTFYGSYTILMAARGGHLAVVDRLLQDGRVDPSYAIAEASATGHLRVVERLLQDERVDPSVLNNQAVRWASSYGHLAVVERLLQDARVDPSDQNNDAIGWASSYGHLAVVERLLQDARVDPSDGNNDAIFYASFYGYSEVVDRLLHDPRVDPAGPNNSRIRACIYNSKQVMMTVKIVRRLFFPDHCDSFDYPATIERLLRDERVAVSTVLNTYRFDPRDIIRQSIKHQNGPFLVYLLRYQQIEAPLGPKAWALLKSDAVMSLVFAAHVESICQQAGIRSDCDFCQGFLAKMTWGHSTHSTPSELAEHGFLKTKLTDARHGILDTLRGDKTQSGPRQLWHEGHFDGALLSITHHWKRLEWVFRHAQIRRLAHPDRMRSTIIRWAEEDQADEP